MITSSRKSRLGPHRLPATRVLSASGARSIACAYEALMPVISSRPGCPHQNRAITRRSHESNVRVPQSSAVGA